MDIFKSASQQKLRFQTDRGILSVDQIWDLTQSQLSTLIKSVKKVLKNTDSDDELSFLTESVTGDTTNQLRFDILKEIYLFNKKEMEALSTQKEIKANNQKILALIAEKKENSLKDKSIEELTAMLK